MSDDHAEYVLAQINEDLRAENKKLRELHDIYEAFFSAWETGTERELRDANDAMIAARKALEQERWTQAEIDAAKAEAEKTSQLLNWGKSDE